MTAPCKVTGCTIRDTSRSEGRCGYHYAEFCRRAGSLRWEGFAQHLADALAAADYQVVGHVTPVLLPVWDGQGKRAVA